MSRLFFKYLLFIILIVNIHAQEDVNSFRTIRFLFFDKPENAIDKLYMHDGKTSQEVELPSMNFSQLYYVPKGVLKLVFTKSPIVDVKNITQEFKVLSVKEDVKDCYILLTQTKAGKDYNLKLLDASFDKLKNGQTKWFNFTPYDIVGKLGNTKFILRKNVNEVMDSPSKNNDSYLALLYFIDSNDEKPNPLCRVNWQPNNTARSLSFVYLKGNQKVPNIKTFVDFRSDK